MKPVPSVNTCIACRGGRPGWETLQRPGSNCERRMGL